MPDPDKQEKYSDLKKATRNSGITAISIFIIDTFILGAHTEQAEAEIFRLQAVDLHGNGYSIHWFV